MVSLRIAVVYRAFHRSGSLSRATVELASRLSERHDVHVFSVGALSDPALAPECTFHDVPARGLGSGSGASARELLSYARNAARLLSADRFDVVHTCAPSTWVADILHVPGVMRGESIGQGDPGWRFAAGLARHPRKAARLFLERKALRARFARIHAAAPSVRDDLVRYYHVDPAQIRVVPPAVNLDRFRPTNDRSTARFALGVSDPGRVIVLFCGKDFGRKGLDRAIEAVALGTPVTELVVVGGGPEQSFRALAEQHGVTARVRFLGNRHDTHLLYPGADIFVLPTRTDVWGVTPIEAMACGVPPIVSGAAGSASAIRDGETGIALREPFDVRALRDAIDVLARDADLRRAMGAAGIEAAKAHSEEERGREIEAELVEVASHKARSRASTSRPVSMSRT